MECLLSGIPKVFCKAITTGMVNTINKLASELKERLEYEVDLCSVEAWEMREFLKGEDQNDARSRKTSRQDLPRTGRNAVVSASRYNRIQLFPLPNHEDGQAGGRGVGGLEPAAVQRVLWEAAVGTIA